MEVKELLRELEQKIEETVPKVDMLTLLQHVGKYFEDPRSQNWYVLESAYAHFNKKYASTGK